MFTRYTKGILGEMYACIYLRLRGYRVLKIRYKTPVGEVDVLLRDGDTIVLVEVKVRKRMAHAPYAITEHQKRRYRNAGRYVHQKYNGVNIRYDAVFVSGVRIKHIENAWI